MPQVSPPLLYFRPGRECSARWGVGAHLEGSGETENRKEAPSFSPLRACQGQASSPIPLLCWTICPLAQAPPVRLGSWPGKVKSPSVCLSPAPHESSEVSPWVSGESPHSGIVLSDITSISLSWRPSGRWTEMDT